jgi:hypothetical protein
MADNVTAAEGAEGTGTAAGPPFVTEKWIGAPGGDAHVGYGKLVWGTHGTFTIVDKTAAAAFPVQVVPTSPAVVDHSVASLSGGGTSDTLLPAAQTGRWTYIFNPEGNDVITLNMLGGAAVAGTIGCIDIAPGGKLELPFVPSAAIKVHGTAAQTVVCLTA